MTKINDQWPMTNDQWPMTRSEVLVVGAGLTGMTAPSI